MATSIDGLGYFLVWCFFFSRTTTKVAFFSFPSTRSAANVAVATKIEKTHQRFYFLSEIQVLDDINNIGNSNGFWTVLMKINSLPHVLPIITTYGRGKPKVFNVMFKYHQIMILFQNA